MLKISVYIKLFFIFMWILTASAAMAQSVASPDANREALKSLLDDLRSKIKNADERMVAHPKFLEELRSLISQYEAKLRNIFFYDDFADGNFTGNPSWVVKKGEFRVTSTPRLQSKMPVYKPSQSARHEENEKAPIGFLLREIIRSGKQKKEFDVRPAPVQEEAVIQTKTRIGPYFELDMVFVSESSWGSMELILLGGSPPTPFYRLVYQAAPSKNRPIEIVRERDSRRYTIESASLYPVLDDGRPHRLQWLRDEQGNMIVLVDEKKVISTVEIFYKDAFSGLSLVNRGGTYEWGPIRILQAPAKGEK